MCSLVQKKLSAFKSKYTVNIVNENRFLVLHAIIFVNLYYCPKFIHEQETITNCFKEFKGLKFLRVMMLILIIL